MQILKAATLYLVIFCFAGFTGLAQTFTVKGRVFDNAGSPAVGAIAVLLKTDSSLVTGATSDSEGNFVIENVSPQSYIFKISYIGFANYMRSFDLKANIDVGVIKLRTFATSLKEVEVITKAPVATLNGDTTSYNSTAYKTNKDASAEDLVTKMPGVTIQEGKVQAQGEDVKQVLVDGQVFFGEDASSVLKNLPAEIIDKVQVFDRKSDQAQFTGFDDGNTSKTINIVTKTQFRNGTFGKVYGGYGYEDKYRGGAVFNRFKNKQRFTVLLMSNNINEQNFSSEDLLGVTSGSSNSRRSGRSGGGRGGSGGPQSDADNFLVNIKNGITTTNAAGINYSDKWNSKTTISASYFFNVTNNNAVSSLLRQYVVGSNNGLNYFEDNNATSDNFNHRLNAKLEIKVDSFNSFIIQPKFSLQQNEGKSELTGDNKNSDFLISSINNSFSSKLTGYNLSLPVQFRHAFAKRGRTLSLDANPSYNKSYGDNFLKTYSNYFTDTIISDTLDQKSLLNLNGVNASGSVVYTEPISTKSFLSANYSVNFKNSSSEKNTYNKEISGESYTSRDSLLSNIFDNQYISHAIGSSYRFSKEKFSFMVGASVQQAQLYKTQKFPDAYNDTRIFNSIIPNANFQYRFTPKKNLRFNYRSFNSVPSIDQLQNVLNNNNTLQLSIGNPELRQTFQNNFILRYSGVNIEKATSLFALIGGTYTGDYIGNSTIIAASDTVVFNDIFLAKGSQISRPVNLDNYYNARTFINYSFAIKQIKSNLNINASASYNNVPAMINNKVNYSNTTNSSIGLVLSSNISEKFDFMISATPSYNYVSNTLQSNLNSIYFNQISRAKITVTPVKWLQLQAEYSNQYYNGLSGGFNQNISLLNASLAYKFLKNQQAELRLFVFDILKQNNSVQRTTTETYIEDSQTNILQRYVMISFTYNFKKYFESKERKAE